MTRFGLVVVARGDFAYELMFWALAIVCEAAFLQEDKLIRLRPVWVLINRRTLIPSDHLLWVLYSSELRCIIVENTAFILALVRLYVADAVQNHHLVVALDNQMSPVHLTQVILVHLIVASVRHYLARQILVIYINTYELRLIGVIDHLLHIIDFTAT